MNTKIWCKKFILFIFIGLLIVSTFVYMVDPLWTFQHSNKINSTQLDFNERQQKTNFINFNQLNNFNGILLGSSRTTYIDQNDFHNMRIYNYALSAIFPYEYQEYINFAQSKKIGDLKYILIGLDFFGSNVPKSTTSFEKPKYYINNSTSFLYRYKMLFSIDNLKYSIKNLKKSLYFTMKMDTTAIILNII